MAQLEGAAAPLATPKDYVDTFVASPPGAKVLQHLTALYHDRPTFVSGGVEGARETEKRAAQKDVVGFILRQIGQLNEDPHAD